VTNETVRLVCGIGAVLLLLVVILRRGKRKKTDLDKL
jgi:hypothetical protein